MVITFILFSVIQYNEYNRNKKNRLPHNMFSLKNISTFILLYILSTIIMYMTFSQPNIANIANTVSQRGGDNISKSYISADPHMLRKITDDVEIGFSPV